MDYWEAHPSEYGSVVYEQGACALSALAARFGLERFVDVLADYVAVHRLGFSTTARFTSAIESAAAALPTAWDPTAFWDRWRIGPP
jgi:aminopeptidase N